MSYDQYVRDKLVRVQPTGFEPGELHTGLFPHQHALVQWSLRRGRCAVFADTGLGKTRIQLEWAARVHEHTGKDVLILAPLLYLPPDRMKAFSRLSRFGMTFKKSVYLHNGKGKNRIRVRSNSEVQAMRFFLSATG